MANHLRFYIQLLLDGKYQEAIHKMRKHIAKSDSSNYEDYRFLAIIYHTIDDVENQEEVYKEIDRLQIQDHADYYNDYAELLIAQQRFSEALTIIQRGIRQHPTAEELFYTEAFIWYMTEEDIEGKNVNRAYNAINKAIRFYTQQDEFAYSS